MYEELIKNLRVCSRCDFGQNCNECTQRSEDRFCCDVLLHKAADAIEELVKGNESLAADLADSNERRKKKRKPQWIPVTERLPEKSGWYLTFVCNKWQGSLSDQTVSIWDGERFHVGSFAIVTHWMPLPEPPKDGE